MNLAEALNAALPELPAKRVRPAMPKLNPRLVVREQIDDGKPVMMAIIPGSSSFFRFEPEQWQLVELFNGERTYEEVIELYREMTGAEIPLDDLKSFVEIMDEQNLWYRTAVEKNIVLQEKMKEHRHDHQKKKSKWGDVSHMQFSAWDPDRFMRKFYNRIRWVYTPWFTGLTVALFAFMVYIFIIRWGAIGADSLKYYTFTEKTAVDLAEFWVLFLILAFFHESAHGITCIHYGGGCHSMGFHLIYLTPAFFVDVSEAWVYASRWQRLATIIAGVWVEMIFCAIATITWWGTPSGTYVHELSYKIMLITGAPVLIVNMNPLIKLDGYYAFSEILGYAGIKEKSTEYFSSLVKKHIFRLPVEIPFVIAKRKPLFITYAILSGIYSYALLIAAAAFARNVFARYSPDWAFVPWIALLLLIFRSRIRTLVKFMKTVWLDKKDLLRSWATPPKLAVVGGLLLVVLFAPIWRQSVAGQFILEPQRREFLRAEVPGQVVEVNASEGELVKAGIPIFRLRALDLQSQAQDAEAKLRIAEVKANQAQLQYAGYAAAITDRNRYQTESSVLQKQVAKLTLAPTFDGTVITPRIHDLIGRQVEAGTLLAEIADTSTVRARIYVPEYEMAFVRINAPVRIHFHSLFKTYSGAIADIMPASQDLPDGLSESQKYRGIGTAGHFVADVLIANDRNLRDGMTGEAKIFVQRRSIAGFAWQTIHEFVSRKVW